MVSFHQAPFLATCCAPSLAEIYKLAFQEIKLDLLGFRMKMFSTKLEDHRQSFLFLCLLLPTASLKFCITVLSPHFYATFTRSNKTTAEMDHRIKMALFPGGKMEY